MSEEPKAMTTTTTTRRPRIKRGAPQRLQLAADVHERLRAIADIYGMPPSTLASLAIGQWVAQQERSLNMAITVADRLGESFGEEVRKQFGLFDKGPAKGKP